MERDGKGERRKMKEERREGGRESIIRLNPYFRF